MNGCITEKLELSTHIGYCFHANLTTTHQTGSDHAAKTAAQITPYSEAGIFSGNPRFYPMPVGWNLRLTQKRPTPVTKADYSIRVNWSYPPLLSPMPYQDPPTITSAVLNIAEHT